MAAKKPASGEAHAIVVGIRVRPFNQREIKYNSTCIVSMEGNCTKIHEVNQGKILMAKPREFVFDYAFWTHSKDGSGAPAPAAGTAPSAPPPFADQQFVYERLGVQIVQNVFEGFNSCLFAYGQTGSGKTYSMMGIPTDPGMLPRIGTDIFERAEMIMAAGNECTVKASFCELYNEKCRDLLAPPDVDKNGKPTGKDSAELKIRMHPQTGVFVEGITSYTLSSPEEYFKLLERGLSHRTTASTNMNATSSRSHGIVLLTVFQKDCNGSKTGKMSLVDLAGSERVAATGATGATAVEGQNINRSLTTLGMVLSKLADRANAGDKPSAAQNHIPYRDSQLTFLLMDNLGGNSKTSMIAAISPASVNYDETLSTLRFSSVAKKVKSIAVVNEDPNDKLIRELKTELTELRDRLRRLQEKKQQKILGIAPSLSPPTTALLPDAPPPSGEIQDANTFPSSSPGPTPMLETPAPVAAAEGAGGSDSAVPSTRGTPASQSGAVSRTATPPPTKTAAAAADAIRSSAASTPVAQGHESGTEGEDGSSAHQASSSTNIPPQASIAGDGLAHSRSIMSETSVITAGLREQIEVDESALASLETPPLAGAMLLDDARETTRVHLKRTPSVMFGSVAAPNPVLVHAHGRSLSGTGRSISLNATNSTAVPVSRHRDPNGTSEGVEEAASSVVPILGSGAGSAANSMAEILPAPTVSTNRRRNSAAAVTFDVPVVDELRFYQEGDDANADDGNDEDDDEAAMEAANQALLDAADREDGLGEEDEEEEEPGSPKREVMVDWRAPQLVNLKPEAGGDVLVIPLSEGETDCEFDDVLVYFNYDALAAVVTMWSDNSSAVFLNGIAIEDEGTVIRHNDRIVVGENAFRFAFTAQDAPDFKTCAVSLDHVILLEKYERMKIVEERAKNALSIGKAYFTMLSEITHGDIKPPTINMTPRGGSGMTPRSSNQLLAAIGDDSAYTNQLVYEIEKQLAEEFPADAEDFEDTQLNVDLEEYNEALLEKSRMLKQQQDEVSELREMLERQNKLAISTASPTYTDASEELVVQESINAACSEAILQRELLWHKQVKMLKSFKANGGPSDAVDLQMWRRLASDPPFACDPLLKLERTMTTVVSDPKTKEGSRKWQTRFVACSRQFAFVFRQTNDVQPCLGAVYLPGATVTAPSDRASRMGDSMMGADGAEGVAPRYFVEVAPAVPRSTTDNAVSSHQCAVKFGFDDEITMLSWRQFFEECAAPQMPLSMLKRWTKEFVASHGTISVFEDISATATVAAKGDMMPGKMRWKPDSSVDACEDCRKPFKLILRGKHHCRGCGGIFCAECLEGKGDEKKCENCRYTYKRAARKALGGAAGVGSAAGSCRRTNIMSEFELKHSYLLRETFYVRLEIISDPNEAETLRRLKVPAEAITAAMASGYNLRKKRAFGEPEEEDGVIKFQIDHYRGRAHTFTGDEIYRVERSLLVPNVLQLQTVDGATIKLTFDDAMARERCIESLFVLMGCRVYMPGLRDVAEISNVVVTNEVGEDCYFRMTNTIAVDARLWVGIEDGRTIPFHDNYAVWAFVGHKETWNEQSLKAFRLCLLEQAQLARDTYLYVVCTLEWRKNIMAINPCPVSRSSRYTVGAIGLRMLESTVLFVGVHQPSIVYNDFVDVHDGSSPNRDHLFSLGHISTTNLPVVDALQQYDHAFLINSPGLPQFLQANPVVHYSSPNVEVMLAGRSSVELVVPCVGFACAKFCERPSQRPVFKLLSALIIESKSHEDIPPDRVPKEDIVSQCQLWCSVGFDRLYQGEIVTDPTRLHSMACSDAKASAYGEVMLVNTMPEYCSLGKLFVVCADMGSIALNIAQVMAPLVSSAEPMETQIVCEVMRGGKVTAIADIKLSARWEDGYTGVESRRASRVSN